MPNGDLYENDNPAHCRKNIFYKLKNKLKLSEENFSRLSHPEITNMKIGEEEEDKRDLMQYALLNNDKENVRILSKFFVISDYAAYLGKLPRVVQENMQDLFDSTVKNPSFKK